MTHNGEFRDSRRVKRAAVRGSFILTQARLNMARVVIYLLEPEINALHQLAQEEYRPLKSQSDLIIRNELRSLGLIDEQLTGRGKQPEVSPKSDDREATC